MSREAFTQPNFKPLSISIIQTANQILAQYTANNIQLTLRALVRDAILRYRDEDAWAEMVAREERGRKALKEFAETYTEEDE